MRHSHLELEKSLDLEYIIENYKKMQYVSVPAKSRKEH